MGLVVWLITYISDLAKVIFLACGLCHNVHQGMREPGPRNWNMPTFSSNGGKVFVADTTPMVVMDAGA
jgi:hypothetical protein